MRRLPWPVHVLIAVAALALYLYAAGVQLRVVNTDLTRSDQRSYMGYAIELKESSFTYVGDRNRMPLYPALTTLIYREGMSDEVFFTRGKWFNVALSCLLLAGLMALFRRHLALHSAANLLAIIAFSLFVFKAPCFQGELLYYSLSFAGLWLLARMLVHPRIVTGLSAGAVLAAAHLTKASAIGCLALFTLVAVLSALASWRGHASERAEARSTLLAGTVVAILTFLVLLSPYLINSRTRYGRFFYNVNTTFYMWYDSWDEVKAGTRAHGDRKGWPDMPADQIPSPARYVQTHTLRQIVAREVDGMRVVIRDRIGSYGHFKYAAGAAALALGLALWRPRAFRDLIRRYRWPILFWASYLSAYLALYAWWVPISPAPRLVLALFVPYMWGLFVAIHRLLADAPDIALRGRRVSRELLFNTALSAILIVDVALVVSGRIAEHYGCT